jgi:hypothetical protein
MLIFKTDRPNVVFANVAQKRANIFSGNFDLWAFGENPIHDYTGFGNTSLIVPALPERLVCQH